MTRRFLALTFLITIVSLAAGSFWVMELRGRTSHAQAEPKLEIDMVQDAGGTWCNPVDGYAIHALGETYEVAICLTDAPSPPRGFAFEVNYDSQLNDCIDGPASCGPECLDSNPDVNGGSTKFAGTLPAPNGLGENWECDTLGILPPACSNGWNANAFLQCIGRDGTYDLPVGAGVSEPIAVITFMAVAAGIDNVAIENADVIDVNETEFVFCYPPQDHCVGVENNGGVPYSSPTPTFTPTPTVFQTPTPTSTPWSTPTPAVPPPLVSLTQTEEVLLPGVPWDFAMNPEADLVYVTSENSITREAFLSAIDSDANTLLATVNHGTHFASFIGFSPLSNRLFWTTGLDGTVLVLDANTYAWEGDVHLASASIAAGVTVDPFADLAFVGDFMNTVYMIDAATLDVLLNPRTDAHAVLLAANPIANRLYVAGGLKLAVIEESTMTQETLVPVDNDGICYGLAVNPITNRIYVVGQNDSRLYVVDGLTNATIATVDLPGKPCDVDVDAVTNVVYVAGENGLSAVDGNWNVLLADVPLGSLQAVGVDSSMGTIYAGGSGAQGAGVAYALKYTDADEDGMSDTYESNHTCLESAEPDASSDADSDGLTNIAEMLGMTDPCRTDSDVDGVLDNVDNCPWFSNSDQKDTNGNAVGDACDPEKDGDGVVNGRDNCADTYNPDQTSTDRRRESGTAIESEWASNPATDRMGDACDQDADNDGLPNADEAPLSLSAVMTPLEGITFAQLDCPSPIKGDSDGDGMLDGYEVANGSDPCDVSSKPRCTSAEDSDGDGLNDCLEHFGYNTCASEGDTVPDWGTCADPADSDGDGCADVLEVMDINGDRKVTVGDLTLLAKRGVNIVPPSDSDPIFDVNKDAKISIGDLTLMAKNTCALKPWLIGCSGGICPAE